MLWTNTCCFTTDRTEAEVSYCENKSSVRCKKDFIPEVRYGHIALEVLDFSSSRRNRFGCWWNLVMEQYLVLHATSMLLVSRRIVFAC
jgi:hypothetical protein